jgi:hypothetical protein
MRSFHRCLLLVVVASFPACNSDSPNPFTDPGRASPPAVSDQIVFTANGYDPSPGLPRDAFSADPESATTTRLTYCNQSGSACDTIEAIPAPSDRQRMAFRRIYRDTNGDGVLSTADAAELIVADLARGVQAPVIREFWNVNGVSWFGDTELVLSATIPGAATENLFIMNFDGTGQGTLTTDDPASPVRERRPTFGHSGQAVVYERIESDGKGTLWAYPQAIQITFGGPGSDPLPGTPYVVGCDADPVFAPDDSAIAFRRLSAVSGDGRGLWAIMTVSTAPDEDGTYEIREILPGDRYRGAPDWGPDGLLFEEGADNGSTELVVVQADGSGRRVLGGTDSSHLATYPHWLAQP